MRSRRSTSFDRTRKKWSRTDCQYRYGKSINLQDVYSVLFILTRFRVPGTSQRFL